MDKIKGILLKILVIMIIILAVPFLFVVGIIYFMTKGMKSIKL